MKDAKVVASVNKSAKVGTIEKAGYAVHNVASSDKSGLMGFGAVPMNDDDEEPRGGNRGGRGGRGGANAGRGGRPKQAKNFINNDDDFPSL